MKEQILQILLHIASGEAIAQDEKTIYPAVREQLAAIKAIMTLQGWDRKETKKKAVAPEETPLEATADTTIVGETSVQREQEFTTGKDVTPDIVPYKVAAKQPDLSLRRKKTKRGKREI